MLKEFVPYKEALALKELGFIDDCLAFYRKDKLYFSQEPINPNSEKQSIISAPLYQQAFKWFREKYNLCSYVSFDPYSGRKTAYWHIGGGIWDLNGYKDTKYDWDSNDFSLYEEAELDCLKKLIEITKENLAYENRLRSL